MSNWYILHKDHTTEMAISEEEKMQAYAALEGEGKIVAQERVGDRWVSTVFLGLDHNYNDAGPPLIFETMVFKGEHGEDEGCWRYSTWNEAVEGHGKACAALQSGFSREELEAAKQIIEPLLNSPDK